MVNYFCVVLEIINILKDEDFEVGFLVPVQFHNFLL